MHAAAGLATPFADQFTSRERGSLLIAPRALHRLPAYQPIRGGRARAPHARRGPYPSGIQSRILDILSGSAWRG